MTAGLLRLALAVFAALALLAPAAADATGTWQADTMFDIDPSQVPGESPQAVEGRYQLFDPQGAPLGPVNTQPARGTLLTYYAVPPVPGIYKLEAWTVDAEGNEVTRASTSLHFDDVPPAPPAPQTPDRWLPEGTPAVLRLGHPESPLPISGIRGYAISLDHGSGGGPCASPSRCSAAETDLAGGIDDDSISFGLLAEGITYARVVAVSGAGVPSPVRTATFRVDTTPPRLTLPGLRGDWSNGPVRVAAFAQDSLSGMAAAGASGPLTAISVDGGAPAAAPGDTATTWVSGSGSHTVHAFARDAAGNLTDADEATAPSGTAVVRIDEDPPRVAFAAAQDPAEPERIEALVGDGLSGPSGSRGSIAVRLAGTRARFEELPTRVTAGRLLARWDSDSYPAGKYEFLATGYDLAGNAATGTDRLRGGRMVLVNPLKAPVSLTAKLADGRFGGRLRRTAGGPVAQQRIAVIETFAVGAEPQRRTSFRQTDAGGAFSLRLAPGPSRDVVAYFAGTSTLTRSTGPSAHLGVATGLRLHASAATARVGGKPVIFSGAVRTLGAGGAVEGLPVELQFRYPGAGWRGFRTVEADRRGRFRYAYRFSDDDSRGIRFLFRAHVKGREGWPYEPGSSRPVTVTGG
ncbi:MAG TPA: hypothetical protein VLK37_08985 [Solirubrobacterales bacterium]|nr:hypothetical protein [Solirubrobacterales bacterium]